MIARVHGVIMCAACVQATARPISSLEWDARARALEVRSCAHVRRVAQCAHRARARVCVCVRVRWQALALALPEARCWRLFPHVHDIIEVCVCVCVSRVRAH